MEGWSKGRSTGLAKDENGSALAGQTRQPGEKGQDEAVNRAVNGSVKGSVKTRSGRERQAPEALTMGSLGALRSWKARNGQP
jgi:hypothetical protein